MTRPEDLQDGQSDSPSRWPVSPDELQTPTSEGDEGWIAESSGSDDPEKTLFPPKPWGLGAVLAAIITALAFLGLGLFFVRLAVGEEGAETALAFNVGLAIIVVVMLTTAWLFGPAIHGGGLRSLGLRSSPASRRSSWLLPPAVLVAVLLFNGAYVAVVNQLGLDILQPPELPFSDYSPLALAITGIMVILAGPFAEEVFFRGFVLSGTVRRWGPVTGLLVSAVIFGLAHVSVAILIPIFVAGALLGWLYLRTGSLWACVCVHGAQNAAAFIAALTL